MAIKVVIITVIVFWKVIIMYLKLNEAPRTATLSPLVSLIVGEPSVYKTPKNKATLGFLRELQQGCDVGLEPTTPRTTIWCSTN